MEGRDPSDDERLGGSRWAYWALELFSAAAQLAALPLLVAALFLDIPGIWWFVGIWVASELLLIILRPRFMRRGDGYKPPRGLR